MLRIRRGIPTLRAIAVAETASGGATTAPRANATASGTGRSHQTTTPTAKTLTMTSPTDSKAMGRALRRKSMSEVFSAAAYSRGGRNPISTSSGLSSKSGTPGRKEAMTPTIISTSGAGTESLRVAALTKMTTASSATTATGRLMEILFQPLDQPLQLSASRLQSKPSRRRRACSLRLVATLSNF